MTQNVLGTQTGRTQRKAMIIPTLCDALRTTGVSELGENTPLQLSHFVLIRV